MTSLAPRPTLAPARSRSERGATPRTSRLGRRGRRIALVAHVLSSVGWFGAAGLVLFLLATATATSDDDLARACFRAVETSVWLSVPAAAMATVTGVVLGIGTKWGVVRHWWVVLKEVAVVPLVLTDLLVIAPSAHDAARGVGDGRILDAGIAHCVALAFATIVSVVKPFGRTPWARRRVPSRG